MIMIMLIIINDYGNVDCNNNNNNNNNNKW